MCFTKGLLSCDQCGLTEVRYNVMKTTLKLHSKQKMRDTRRLREILKQAAGTGKTLDT